MKVVARSASPISVMSTCRSSLKVATGRHGRALTGIKANEKQAVAIAKPRMSRREPRSDELVGFGPVWREKLTDAPSACCGVNVGGAALRRCRAGAFRWTLWARILAFFGGTSTGFEPTVGVD